MFFDTETLKKSLITLDVSSPEYPLEWKSLDDAPQTLYALGDIRLLCGRKLAVVGARRTPAPVLKLGASLCERLSHSFTIVTGTADGGDSAAIEGGLQGSGKVLCVLAGGFSALPQGNLQLLERVARRGLIVALHPFETEVRSFSYEYRNKLLAYLCDGALVLGAGEKSGALITANYAQKAGKKVFALPYAPNTAVGVGCNALIKKGAYLTDCAEDVLNVFGIEERIEKKEIALSAEEERLYQALQDLGESHVGVLSQQSGVPIFKARAVLSALEVKGLAVSVGGNRYTLV